MYNWPTIFCPTGKIWQNSNTDFIKWTELILYNFLFHRKYERSKGVLQNLKDNENTLIRRDIELVGKIENKDKKLVLYKEKAQDKLEQ